MNLDEDAFSATSFEDLAAIEPATAEEPVLPREAADEKLPSDDPLDVSHDNSTADKGADEGKDKVGESDWVPTNDIHFVLRWENKRGKFLKECRSLFPYDLPGDSDDDSSSDSSSDYDSSDDESLSDDAPQTRAQATLVGSVPTITFPKTEAPPRGVAVADSSSNPGPTGIPVVEFCVTVYNACVAIPPGANKPNFYDLDSARMRDRFIRIHSLHLINALRAVTEYYPGIDLEASPVKIPVRSYYLAHIYKDLQKHMDQQADLHDEEYASIASKHIKILVDIVEEQFKKEIEESEELQKTGITTYDTVWNLLKPGTKAYYYSTKHQTTLPCIVHSIVPSPISNAWANDVPFYQVEIWRVTWINGKFCRRWMNFNVFRFKGKMKITKLIIYPARFHEQQKGRELLYNEESLGHSCWSAAAKGGPCYLELSDNYKVQGPKNYPITFMSRRLIVDYHHSFNQYPVISFHPRPPPPSSGTHPQPGMSPPGAGRWADASGIPIYAAGCRCEKCKPGDGARPRSLWADLNGLDPTKADKPQLAQYYHAIDKSMPAWLFTSQHHLYIHAKDVQPLGAASIRKQEIVYGSPEITEAIDGIAKSLLAEDVMSRTLNKTSLGGLDGGSYGSRIILFHGAPGTGKTATVEQLAETARRPLFRPEIDLWNVTWSKKHLSSVLNFCEMVGGIAVIDDVDKILGHRMNGMHNFDAAYFGIVEAIDAFRGTLFLTTNCVGRIEPSFLCRISMAIHFPALTEEQRHRIWTNQFAALDEEQQEWPSSGGVSGRKIFISPQTRAFVLESKKIKSLGWNGIEIRNALRSAIQLAQSETVSWPTVTHDIFERGMWTNPGPGVYDPSTLLAPASTSALIDQDTLGCSSTGASDNLKEKGTIIVLERHFKAVAKNSCEFKTLVSVTGMQDKPARCTEEAIWGMPKNEDPWC